MRPVILIFLTAAALAAQPAVRGFHSGELKGLHDREAALRKTTDAGQLRVYLEKMAAEPHHAGSAGSKKVAEYALGLFRSWGYDAQIEEFDALLPYPTSRLLELIEPSPYKAKLQEPVIPEDPDSSDSGQLPTYNSYSASGDVTAPVVYVNYGIPEDYEKLKELGIEVKGKIVIARYGKSWRGTKAKVAQEHGAVGCLIYSDPRDDGFYQGDAYPKGAWRPPLGVQRGSVMDMPLYVGDPLTPGWASAPGTRRLPLNEAATLMKIPVLPISYEDAKPFLEHLSGPVAPEAWRGALPVTYHIGPGPAKARLKVDFDWTSKPFFNVIARMPGAENPEQWIIYGNHHDAWVNGAHDPVSGAAAVLETARAFSELRKTGWQPRRTVLFALWDAEEFGLVGSTEWAEKHAAELRSKGIAYLNSDTNGNGEFNVGGSPSLRTFFSEVLRDTPHPKGGGSVLSSVVKTRSESDFKVGPVGAGSDYVAFIHHLGLPGLNAGFSNRQGGGIYHSIYDSVNWYLKFSDGDFIYGKALADIMGSSLMRLADSPILPFSFRDVSSAIRGYLAEVEKMKGADRVDFKSLYAALERLGQSAAAWDIEVANDRWRNASPDALRDINEALFRAEQALAVPGGLPRRPWYKHVISAPGVYTGYSAKTLPWIREALEAGNFDEAQEGVRQTAQAIDSFEQRIAAVTKLLANLP